MTTHILVIDDDQAVRDSISDFLDDCGFKISTAINGQRGLELIEANKPDLVLCDLRMPVMDGLTLLSHMQNNTASPPTIVISGTGDMQDVVVALRNGAADFITKPVIDMNIILHAVNRVLDRIRLEKENENYRKNLEQQVKVRTAELNKEIEEKTEIQKELEDQLNHKKILLREIHHRVKNNLQVISSLLNLQSGYITDDSLLEVFRESQDRIKSMALIHEFLYKSDELSEIDFDKYLQALMQYLISSYKLEVPLNYEIHSENIILDINSAIPCGLLINEIISNSLKHAFTNATDSGMIDISAAREENNIILEIKDNGVGLPADFGPHAATTLGTQLIYNLSAQIQGTVETIPGKGAHFKIRFPMESPDQ